MDQKELQEKIALFYSKLPPKAQAVFSSMSWLETLKTISAKYSLNDKQVETLGTETTLVLLGIIHLVEYEEALTNELGLSKDIADKIFTEVEGTILNPIHPELVLAFENNKKAETQTTSAPEIEQKLDARFEKLPQGVGDIVKKSNYQAILYDVAKGYNLTVAQMGILETAVTNLIVGTLKPDGFEVYLENNLKIPTDTVNKLVNDVNEKIFKQIRGKLMETTGVKKIEEKEIPEPNSTNTEIIPEKLELAPKKPEIEKVHPILMQKLSNSVQNPMVKTEHTLENITKANTPSPTNAIPQKPKIDPYREMPE